MDALSKSNGIHNLKITDLHGHLLFDSMDPALLAGVDDDDDDDDNTSLAGVQGNNTSLAGVPMPVMTNDNDNDSDAESDHDSIDPNKADNNSSKASVHSTGSHILVHSMTDEPWRTRKSWTSYIYPSWKPKFLYYVDLEEFLYHCPTIYPAWEERPMP